MRLMGRVGFHSAASAAGAAMKAAAKAESSITLRTRICVMVPSGAAWHAVWLPRAICCQHATLVNGFFGRARTRNSHRNAASRSPALGERLNGGLARKVGDETIGALHDGK